MTADITAGGPLLLLLAHCGLQPGAGPLHRSPPGAVWELDNSDHVMSQYVYRGKRRRGGDQEDAVRRHHVTLSCTVGGGVRLKCASEPREEVPGYFEVHFRL